MTTLTNSQKYAATLVQELAVVTLGIQVVQGSRHFDVLAGEFRGVRFELEFDDGECSLVNPDSFEMALLQIDEEAWFNDLDTICGIETA